MPKLFRRHRSDCSQKYSKEERIYEHDSTRATKRPQCDCSIFAEGKLPSGRYLKQKSTGTNNWAAAKQKVDDWSNEPLTATAVAPLTLAIQRPLPPVTEVTGYQLVSVADAVADFISVKRANGTGEPRMAQYRTLLQTRLVHFCEDRQIEDIQEMNHAKAWSDFRLSWVNENPLRNRKPADSESVPVKELTRSTGERMISDLRAFLSHCVSRQWLTENWASRKHQMITTGKRRRSPKAPFSEQDLLYIYRACEHVTDGRGYRKKRTQTEHGFETLVFLWLLRYTGLRISDVVMLRADQIVPFSVDEYTHALACRPGKTERSTGITVHIPLPNGRLPGDPDLVSALKAIRLKHDRFFFFNPKTLPIYCGCLERHCQQCLSWKKKVQQTTNNRRDTLMKVFALAEKMLQEDGLQFSVHPHPHRFRHTFCCRWLEDGASLRMVSEFIGDTEETVLRHYAGFHHTENMLAAQEMAQLSRRRKPLIDTTQHQRIVARWQPSA